MQRSTDRMLTTHAGALPRPRALEEIVPTRHEQPERFEQLLPTSVDETVDRQREAGIDIVGDGEMSKAIWSWYVMERLTGFEPRPADLAEILGGQDQLDFPDFYAEAVQQGLWYGNTDAIVGEAYSTTPVCVSPIGYDVRQVRRDIAHLRSALRGSGAAEGFLTAAAPASVEFGQRNEYYATDDDYLRALADALKQEYEAIAAAGFIVQIDDAWTPAMWNTWSPTIDLDTWRRYCRTRVEALNHALAGIPTEQVRYHVCWGSWHGPHTSDIPMSELVHLMLSVDAGAYMFEAGNVRHEHEFVVWDDVSLPDGKIIIPGVVSHATTIVEHPDLVAQRLIRFAERVGRDNVIAGTDCGLGGRVHPSVAWAKLRSLRQGAAIATEQLWTTAAVR